MTVLLAAVAAVVGGILAGERLGPGAAVAPLVAALALLAGALARRGRPGAVLAVLACALLALGLTQRALHGVRASPLSGPASRYESGVLVGTLAEDPAGPRFVVRALVRADRFRGRDAGGRTVLASASGDAVTRLRVLEAGDRVALAGRLGELRGFDARYRWRHAVARLEVREVRAFSGPAAPLARAAGWLRGLVLRGAGGLPADERALLAGFLLGDTRALSDTTIREFRDAGMSHLLAVSGANVAFVLVLVGPALGRLRTSARFVGGLTVLAVFGAMTRWEPSVLRASAMAGLVMLAAFLGRPVAAGRVLALAVLVLLLSDPFLLHSVGFLLSCGACAGIALFAAPIAGRLRGPPWVREGLAVTLAAQIGVAPILLPVFGTVPLVSVPANLVAVPVVGPLTIWGLVAGLAGGVLGPSVARVLQLPTLVLLRWVRLVAATAARTPLAVDGRAVAGLVALGCGTIALLGIRRTPARRLPRDGRAVPGEGDRSHPPGADPAPAARARGR